MLIDSVHIFKCIRNNWMTEMSSKISFKWEEKTLQAKWSNICSMYTREANNSIRRTQLTFQCCYPFKPRTTKGFFHVEVFNEKVVAAAKQDGYLETTEFLDKFTDIWIILNSKNDYSYITLNDSRRTPFTTADDLRLHFLASMSSAVSAMHACKGRNLYLTFTVETKMAFCQTLDGLVHLVQDRFQSNNSKVTRGYFDTFMKFLSSIFLFKRKKSSFLI